MRWSELDLAGRVWRLPKERSKNGREHTVPLSDPAIAILEGLPRIGDAADGFVFSVRSGAPIRGFSRAKMIIDRTILELMREEAEARGDDPQRVRPPEPWVLHDLRRTVATGLQRLGVRLEVTEAVLNHVSGSQGGLVGVYQRPRLCGGKARGLGRMGGPSRRDPQRRAGGHERHRDRAGPRVTDDDETRARVIERIERRYTATAKEAPSARAGARLACARVGARSSARSKRGATRPPKTFCRRPRRTRASLTPLWLYVGDLLRGKVKPTDPPREEVKPTRGVKPQSWSVERALEEYFRFMTEEEAPKPGRLPSIDDLLGVVAANAGVPEPVRLYVQQLRDGKVKATRGRRPRSYHAIHAGRRLGRDFRGALARAERASSGRNLRSMTSSTSSSVAVGAPRKPGAR